MKSYKTYRLHPNPPEGINPDWVWQVSDGSLPGWTVVTDEQYEAYVGGHQEAIAAWNEWSSARAAMVSVRDSILNPAMVMGMQLIKEFASENIALGITQAGMTGAVRNTTASAISALQTGSLYDAIAAARAIPPESYDSTFITQPRILNFINKIEDYLGIPRSTTI